MKEKIEIPLNKNKFLIGIGCSIFLVVQGVWLVTNAYEFQERSFQLLRNPMIWIGVGVFSILFFGAAAIIPIIKLSDKKTGLTIDSNGITDNLFGSRFGLIRLQEGRYIPSVNALSFAVVRNSWERTYSAYKYLLSGGNSEEDQQDAEEFIHPFIDFDDFVLNGLQRAASEQLHLLPQLFWISR